MNRGRILAGKQRPDPEPLWIDDEAELEDYVFDVSLRDSFHQAFPIGDTSWEALQDVRPMVAKARRRRQATRIGVLTATTLVAVAVAAVTLVTPAERTEMTAGPATPSEIL